MIRDSRGIWSSLTFALLCCYIVVLPVRFQFRWLLVRIQLVILVSVGLSVLAGRDRVVLTRTQLAVLVVLGLTVCATIAGQVMSVSGKNFGRIPENTRFLVLALACVLELDTTKRLQKTLAVLTATTATVSFLSIINLFIPLSFAFTGQVRTLGPIALNLPRSLGISMPFGSFGIISVIGTAYASMSLFRPQILHGSERRNVRVLSAIALLLILIGVALGKSRSTILAMLIVAGIALIVGATHPDIRLRSNRPVVPRSILLTGGAVATISSFKLAGNVIEANAASVYSRVTQYHLALELLNERPLFGWGWNYTEIVMEANTTVHNLWLLIGVSLGLPIMLLWLYLFARLALRTTQSAIDGPGWVRPYAVIGTAIVLGGSVELMFSLTFTPATAVLIGLVTAIQGLGKYETISFRST